jgi:transcriptional regulator with XRE-family HTH domain
MKSVTQPKYNPLGGLIRALLAARGLKAFELAERVGVSKQSISKIMTGLKRPRQTTFTKICEVLVSTPEEERALVQAYLNSKALKKDKAAPLDPALEAATLRRRAEQFLAQKTQSIQFKRRVAHILDQAGIPYQQDYCEGNYATDFLIEKDDQRIALECKTNIGRDWEKTLAMAEILKEQLPIETVLCVVPQATEKLPEAAAGLNIVELSDLAERLHQS